MLNRLALAFLLEDLLEFGAVFSVGAEGGLGGDERVDALEE